MQNKKLLVGILCSLLVVMAVGYAAFSTTININGTASVSSSWKVLFTDIVEVSKTSGVTITEDPIAKDTTATFNVGLQSPGDYIEYKIFVENRGTLDAVIDAINASETGSDAIRFEITNIKTGDTLAKGGNTSFNVKIKYDESITSQPNTLTNKLTINITYVQDLGQDITPSEPNIENVSGIPISTKLASAIAEAKNGDDIDFSKTSENSNTNGVYYTDATTKARSTNRIYYFRGAIDNNYVKFGRTKGCAYNNEGTLHIINPSTFESTVEPTQSQCESTYVCDVGNVIKENYGIDYRYVTGLDVTTCEYFGGTMLDKKATYSDEEVDIIWRIVRTNEDGSIRLVTEKTIGSSVFNIDASDNAYVGYMYGEPNSTTHLSTHKNKYNSAIKSFIDDWYLNKSNLSDYSSLYSNETGFCNDRSVAPTKNTWHESDTALGFSKNTTYYGAYNRITNLNSPQFTCENETEDLFTTAKSSKGNKMLTNPIGLLTVDELVYAGGVPNKTNLSYYLSSGTMFWTMSPDKFQNDVSVIWGTYASKFNGENINYIYSGTATFDIAVRPVINIKSTVNVVRGTGYSYDPYVIE